MAERFMLVYAGEGSSHSWTWLADLFESRNMFDVRFVDSKGFSEGLDATFSMVIVSGGDGFKIAGSIGNHGFAHLKGFIHKGGGYLGICAGAYLPLHSSLPPFDQFNVSSTKIENIDCTRPAPGTSPRTAVSYGRCSIFHPVRGEVEVELDGRSVLAPIYGGPIFKEPDRDHVLLRYSRFTDSTEFQYDKSLAQSMMLGHPAGIESVHGKGRLLLFGPHLEHPKYPEANRIFLDLVGDYRRKIEGSAKTDELAPKASGLSRSIGDLKVAVLGLENRSFLVGRKLWDGSRLLELIAAIEKRAETVDDSTSSALEAKLDVVRESLVSSDSGEFADSLDGPELLVEAARVCVDNHFSVMRENR